MNHVKSCMSHTFSEKYVNSDSIFWLAVSYFTWSTKCFQGRARDIFWCLCALLLESQRCGIASCFHKSDTLFNNVFIYYISLVWVFVSCYAWNHEWLGHLNCRGSEYPFIIISLFSLAELSNIWRSFSLKMSLIACICDDIQQVEVYPNRPNHTH